MPVNKRGGEVGRAGEVVGKGACVGSGGAGVTDSARFCADRTHAGVCWRAGVSVCVCVCGRFGTPRTRHIGLSEHHGLCQRHLQTRHRTIAWHYIHGGTCMDDDHNSAVPPKTSIQHQSIQHQSIQRAPFPG